MHPCPQLLRRLVRVAVATPRSVYRLGFFAVLDHISVPGEATLVGLQAPLVFRYPFDRGGIIADQVLDALRAGGCICKRRLRSQCDPCCLEVVLQSRAATSKLGLFARSVQREGQLRRQGRDVVLILRRISPSDFLQQADFLQLVAESRMVIYMPTRQTANGERQGEWVDRRPPGSPKHLMDRPFFTLRWSNERMTRPS